MSTFKNKSDEAFFVALRKHIPRQYAFKLTIATRAYARQNAPSIAGRLQGGAVWSAVVPDSMLVPVLHASLALQEEENEGVAFASSPPTSGTEVIVLDPAAVYPSLMPFSAGDDPRPTSPGERSAPAGLGATE